MARNRQQNEKMRSDRREQIMKAALILFTTKGLFATKVKDIAEEVGMAQGLIYHYFKSKEEIFEELISDALDKMNEAADMLKTMEARPHVKIRIAVEQLMHTIENSSEFVQTTRLIAQAINSTAIPENAKRLIDEKRDKPYTVIAEIMAAGQKEGTIIKADPAQLAVMFWTSINGLSIYRATRVDAVHLPEPYLLTRLFLEDSCN